MALTQVDQSLLAGSIGADKLAGSIGVDKLASSTHYTGFKNRIINGDMRIDQRNAGNAVTGITGGTYVLDRWTHFQNYGTVTIQQSPTAPSGYTKSLYTTVSSAASASSNSIYSLVQNIEGYNIADLDFGTVNASSITISFKVRSSLIGTYGVFIRNSAENRHYVTTFSISSANTWTSISLTVPGDTLGTWSTTNSVGLCLGITLGAGSAKTGTTNTWGAAAAFAPSSQVDWMATNGATFYITGVQLEKGSTATAFDYRDYGRELAMCQRYYQSYGYGLNGSSGDAYLAIGTFWTGSEFTAAGKLPVVMRASPSYSSPTVTNGYRIGAAGTNRIFNSLSYGSSVNTSNFIFGYMSVSPAGTAGHSGLITAIAAGAKIELSAEL